MATNNDNDDLDLQSLETNLPTKDVQEAMQMAFNAACNGQAVTLHAILKNQALPEQKEILKTPIAGDDGQSCPLLVISSRNGHENCVKILLSKFAVDLECTGKVRFDPYIIEGASALWCAAGAGHLPIVKLLVGAGANVNHLTKSNSTPLRAACFDGRADVVKFLIEEGKADYNIANKFNNTCLMIAAFNGHLSVVRYLLEIGIDPNVSANCGATALHFSAENGALDIVKELVERGQADVLKKNNYGLNSLMSAAEHCQETVFEYLYEKCEPLMSDEEKILAFELLGASFANDKERYDLQRCYHYLNKAMTMRSSDNGAAKLSIQAIKAYDNHKEAESLAELQMQENLPHQLHMEGLAVRERILGLLNPELPHAIVYRGAVHADAKDFEKCIILWLHALQIKQDCIANASVTKDVLRFAQVFCQMIGLAVKVNFPDFLRVLESTAKAIEKGFASLQNQDGTGDDDEETCMEELDANMLTFLYLVVIFTKLGGDEKEIFDTMRVIHRIVAELQPLSAKSGRSLLHLVVDSQTTVNDFHIRNLVHFPCAKVAKILIEAGSNVQLRDAEGNTPLHLIVGYQRVVGDFRTLHSIITALIGAGAHVDVVNNEGKTPMAKASTGVAEIILKSEQKLSLKCLSAQAVKRHGLSYIGQVPTSLEHFIALHGP